MSKYVKKPVVIEATEWLGHGDHTWVEHHPPTFGQCPQCSCSSEVHGLIKTLEGNHIVCPGDWIIKGIRGEHYPCKPGIFEETYKKVDG